MKKIVIGSDHRGVDLKNYIACQSEAECELVDCGAYSSESCDYPDIAKIVAQKISSKEAEIGILICASGIGMSIAANRVSGVRAALCHTQEQAQLARMHNDANVLVLGAKFISPKEAMKCVEIFLNTDFEGGRHSDRVQKI